MSRLRHISILHIARLAVVLAGATVLALVAFANSAQAGCGDYVFVRNANGVLVRASTLMNGHGGCTGPNCHRDELPAEPNAAEPAAPVESVPIQLPCNGPNCSSRSEVPASPSPLPSPTRTAQESTALLLNLNSRENDSDARFGSIPSVTGHELHYPQSIFHPPR
jgi:hypothetical protein